MHMINYFNAMFSKLQMMTCGNRRILHLLRQCISSTVMDQNMLGKHLFSSFQTYSSVCESKKDVDIHSFTRILSLEVNENILKMNENNTILDKVVNWILKKDIKVYTVALDASSNYFWSLKTTATEYKAYKRRQVIKKGKFPKEIKAGFFSPSEDETISSNVREIMEISEKEKFANNEMLLHELFSEIDDKNYKAKVNIVGHFLAQGLKSPRLACEVARRAKALFVDNTGPFTAKEDDEIMKFMKEEKFVNAYAELSCILGRSSVSIYGRYNSYLRFKDKEKVGIFSSDENKCIVKAILLSNQNALETNVIDKDVIEVLAQDLSRKPANIKRHWLSFIQPLLIRHKAGVLDVDFRHILIDYCVENKIVYTQDANWTTISKEARFRGTTSRYLSEIYKSVRHNAKRRFPEMTDAQLTSDCLKYFLQNHSMKSKSGNKTFAYLTSFYDDLTNPMLSSFSHEYINNKSTSIIYNSTDLFDTVGNVDEIEEIGSEKEILKKKILKLLKKEE